MRDAHEAHTNTQRRLRYPEHRLVLRPEGYHTTMPSSEVQGYFICLLRRSWPHLLAINVFSLSNCLFSTPQGKCVSLWSNPSVTTVNSYMTLHISAQGRTQQFQCKDLRHQNKLRVVQKHSALWVETAVLSVELGKGIRSQAEVILTTKHKQQSFSWGL